MQAALFSSFPLHFIAAILWPSQTEEYFFRMTSIRKCCRRPEKCLTMRVFSIPRSVGGRSLDSSWASGSLHLISESTYNSEDVSLPPLVHSRFGHFPLPQQQEVMVLFSFLSFAALGAVLANAAPKPDPPIRLTLDYAFTQAGKKFWGAAADPKSLNASNNERLMTVEYGQITPAQSFDWAITEPRPGVFNFDNADYMVKWAVNNRKVIRAGPLLSHSSIPPWVSNLTSRDEMVKAIDSHIATLVSRYKDVVYAWDVISEPFNEDGSFRGAPFYDVLGLDYFRIALNAARRSDPKAKLYINDYNMDDDNPKTQAMAKVVLKLNSESFLPAIDGIGTYVYLRQRQPGYGTVPTALKILSQATVDLALTQLYVPNAPEIGYLTIVRGCLAVSRCISITNHQPSDWTPGIIVPEVYTGSLFDYSGNPKSTYKAVVDFLLSTAIMPARS